VQGGDVFSDFLVVGESLAVKSVRQLQTSTGFYFGLGRSLQTLVLATEFVQEHQFLSIIHYPKQSSQSRRSLTHSLNQSINQNSLSSRTTLRLIIKLTHDDVRI